MDANEKQFAATLFPGVYWLQSVERTTPDGHTSASPAYGGKPDGVLMYSELGYMSALITASDAERRPAHLKFHADEDQSDADWAKIGRNMTGYSGPWTIRDAHAAAVEEESDVYKPADLDALWAAGKELRGTVVHGKIDIAVLPVLVASHQVRSFAFSDHGNKLILSVTINNNIETLTWIRKPKHNVLGG